jgi:hypothetical protein
MGKSKMTIDATCFKFNSGIHLDYIKTAYTFLIEAYQQLIENNYNAISKNENTIRDDLVKIAKTKKNAALLFSWITEFPDIENNNRIDINLITPHNLGDEPNYIKIECKILGEANKYIDDKNSFERKKPTNGIMSFITGKYSPQMPIAGMIGFIKDGTIQTKIDSIYKRLEKHKDIKTIQNLIAYSIEENFNFSYHSIHKRNCGLNDIAIYHLFFDYTK